MALGFFKLLFGILFLALIVALIPQVIMSWYARDRIFSAENAPFRRVAIVFGAGLWRDGSPTPVLRDRVATAAELYFTGKVEKILMSGDNRFVYYNEPAAMREYALQLGIPAEDIVLDYAGRRTYDTCYRAKAIFGLSQATLITQGFHLPRAVYTCNFLGLGAIGVPADRRSYPRISLMYWRLREVPASLVALWEVHIWRPIPVLGNPEPIFPEEAE